MSRYQIKVCFKDDNDIHWFNMIQKIVFHIKMRAYILTNSAGEEIIINADAVKYIRKEEEYIW